MSTGRGWLGHTAAASRGREQSLTVVSGGTAAVVAPREVRANADLVAGCGLQRALVEVDLITVSRDLVAGVGGEVGAVAELPGRRVRDVAVPLMPFAWFLAGLRVVRTDVAGLDAADRGTSVGSYDVVVVALLSALQDVVSAVFGVCCVGICVLCTGQILCTRECSRPISLVRSGTAEGWQQGMQ